MFFSEMWDKHWDWIFLRDLNDDEDEDAVIDDNKGRQEKDWNVTKISVIYYQEPL